MAKKAYVGVNNVARKVSKMYVGVGGIARKVKKAYVGVGGVARLFFQKGMDFNKIQITTRVPLDETASATNSNYVLIGGGETRTQSSTSTQPNLTVDAFDNNLTRTACTDLSGMRSLRGGSSENYAMLASLNSNINIYNNSLSKQTISTTLDQNGTPGGDTLNHCVFETTNLSTQTSLCCIDKSTLSKTNTTGLEIPTGLTTDPSSCSRFKNSWYCFGWGSIYVRSYNENLTRQANVSHASHTSAAGRMGVGTTLNYLICAGGQSSSINYASVFAMDENNTITSISSLNVAASNFSGCGNDEYCMFSNGSSGNSGNVSITTNNYVYAYSDNLTKSLKYASNMGAWTYGSINFKDRLFLPNGRVYSNPSTGSGNYDTGVIDVWS